MEPCNNSSGGEAGNFLSDRQSLCLFAHVSGVHTHRNPALFRGSLRTEVLSGSFSVLCLVMSVAVNIEC